MSRRCISLTKKSFFIAILITTWSLTGCQNTPHTHTIDNSSLTIQNRIAMYHNEAAKAAKVLVEQTPVSDHVKLLYPFSSKNRVYGTETKNTPSFCAVLAWCEPWGLKQGDMSEGQLIAMHKLLATTLSAGGYQTFLAFMNRHRILGEIEDVATADFLESVEAKCPSLKARTLSELMEKCPQAETTDYISLAGAKTPTNGEYDMTWVWKKDPGLEKRRAQFDNFSIAIFGDIGSSDWSIRFEGHHATLNVHFHTDKKSGLVSVANTPLFFGSSPVIIPKDPHDGDITKQWNWTKGQVLMYKTIDNLREYWIELPQSIQQQAFISKDNFKQYGVLSVETMPPWLLSTLEPKVNTERIDAYSHSIVNSHDLPKAAVWRLEETFNAYLGSMNAAVAAHYQQRIKQALTNGAEIKMAWAGGDLADKGSQHFSYIEVAGLLLEFQQSNQWSAQHDPNISGNHVHSMLRDLTYTWDYDPISLHLKEHGHGHHH